MLSCPRLNPTKGGRNPTSKSVAYVMRRDAQTADAASRRRLTDPNDLRWS